MRIAVLSVVSLLVFGCASRPETGTHTPPRPAPSAPEASVPADASDAAVSDASEDVDEETPDGVVVDAVVQAASLAFTRPAEARARLSGVRHPLARGWRAWLLATTGDEQGARDELALSVSTEDGGPTSTVGAALAVMREGWDRLSASPDDPTTVLPCALFERNPSEALDAFGIEHGSNLDSLARRVVGQCTLRRVEGALPEPSRPRAAAARQAVLGAVFLVLPMPEEGTMFRSMGMGLGHRFDAAHWLPLDADEAAARRELDARVRGLGSACPAAVRARAQRYSSAVARHVPPLAEALAATARLRGEAVTPAQATAAARALTLRVLSLWLTDSTSLCEELRGEHGGAR